MDAINQLIAAGDYYEASQRYRTVFHRLLKKGENEQALTVARDAALVLLQHGQAASATDMALLLLDTLKQLKRAVDDRVRGYIVDVFAAYDKAEPLRQRLLEAALKWSTKSGGGKHGDAQLHHLVGVVLLRQGDAVGAQEHLYLGTTESAEEMARLSFANVPEGERDVVCVRAVLQYLCLQNVRNANSFYGAFTKLCFRHDPSLRTAQTTVPTMPAAGGGGGEGEGPTTRTIVTSKLPLLNFALFVLLLVERNAQQHYRNLRRHYQSALERDPAFKQMLDQIGELYFGLRTGSAAGGLNRMLGNAGAS